MVANLNLTFFQTFAPWIKKLMEVSIMYANAQCTQYIMYSIHNVLQSSNPEETLLQTGFHFPNNFHQQPSELALEIAYEVRYLINISLMYNIIRINIYHIFLELSPPMIVTIYGLDLQACKQLSPPMDPPVIWVYSYTWSADFIIWNNSRLKYLHCWYSLTLLQ